MSFEKRVLDCISKLNENDYESALFMICSCVEATAASEFGKDGKNAFKEFLHQNLGLITSVAFGFTSVLNINVAFSDPRVKQNPNGTCSIQELLYHVVRCGLYHKAEFTNTLEFIPENKIICENNTVKLPGSLVRGILLAVIVSPTNCNRSLGVDYVVNLPNATVPIDLIWGRRIELQWLLDCGRFLMRNNVENLG
jgi:hypothetical protein